MLSHHLQACPVINKWASVVGGIDFLLAPHALTHTVRRAGYGWHAVEEGPTQHGGADTTLLLLQALRVKVRYEGRKIPPIPT